MWVTIDRSDLMPLSRAVVLQDSEAASRGVWPALAAAALALASLDLWPLALGSLALGSFASVSLALASLGSASSLASPGFAGTKLRGEGPARLQEASTRPSAHKMSRAVIRCVMPNLKPRS